MTSEEFKVILVGESGVGKTSFVIRFSDSKFQNVYESTIGVDCKKVRICVEGIPVDLNVWDTAGQERFKSIVNRFFRQADGVIIMYDVTRQNTFDEVSWWIKETREHLTGIPIFLVGNKVDDEKQPEVLEELAQDFAEENRLYLFHTSARDNLNVQEVFHQLATMMLSDRRNSEDNDERSKLYERNKDPRHDINDILLRSEMTTSQRSCCGYHTVDQNKGRLV